MNIGNESGSQTRKKPSFSDSEPSAKDEVIAELEAELQQEKDQRRGERFYWIICVIMLMNFWFLPGSNNWGAPIAIVLIELVFVVAAAQSLGMNIVNTFMQKALEAWGNNKD